METKTDKSNCHWRRQHRYLHERGREDLSVPGSHPLQGRPSDTRIRIATVTAAMGRQDGVWCSQNKMFTTKCHLYKLLEAPSSSSFALTRQQQTIISMSIPTTICNNTTRTSVSIVSPTAHLYLSYHSKPTVHLYPLCIYSICARGNNTILPTLVLQTTIPQSQLHRSMLIQSAIAPVTPRSIHTCGG